LRELAQFDEELRGLCKDTPEYQEVQDKIETLRAPLPTSILSHYDGRKARGKLAITPVRGGSVELHRVADDLIDPGSRHDRKFASGFGISKKLKA
jgi:hypothetical protein